MLGEGCGQYRGGEGRYSPAGTKAGREEHMSFAASSKEDKKVEIISTPAMTEAFKIS